MWRSLLRLLRQVRPQLRQAKSQSQSSMILLQALQAHVHLQAKSQSQSSMILLLAHVHHCLQGPALRHLRQDHQRRRRRLHPQHQKAQRPHSVCGP